MDVFLGEGATGMMEAERTPMAPLSVGATTGWAILTFVVAQAVGAAIVLTWFSHVAPSSVSTMQYDGTLVALVTLITNPVQVVLLGAVARRARWNPAEYLGLTRFTLRDFLVSFLAVATLPATIDG